MLSSSCPGSRAIKEPTPEYIKCPTCQEEVEVWTHEMSHPCPKCGTRVFRVQRPSCVDWCPHAEQCVGPDVYQKIKKSQAEAKGPAQPLDFIMEEHEGATKQAGVLRAGIVCIAASAKSAEAYYTQVLAQCNHSLHPALDFLDGELESHFRREEEVLFPVLEKHMGKKGSPTGLLLQEHVELRKWREALKQKLAEMGTCPNEEYAAKASEAYEAGSRILQLLPAHIKKENDTLMPLAKGLLRPEEVAQVCSQWKSIA